jgi:prepilin-type N-terminal cleavage/methylation domain-containing protein
MPSHDRDDGYTLVEVLVVMSLLGVMMAIAVSGWSSWARSSQQAGTATSIQTTMRAAQQRAVTEGRSACVLFDTAADTYTVYRGACDDAAKVRVLGPIGTQSGDVEISAPSFTSLAGVVRQGVTFRARGTAWAGQVLVTRRGAAKTYTIAVERLTGRVTLS